MPKLLKIDDCFQCPHYRHLHVIPYHLCAVLGGGINPDQTAPGCPLPDAPADQDDGNDYREGDTVKITSGVFIGAVGKVAAVGPVNQLIVDLGVKVCPGCGTTRVACKCGDVTHFASRESFEK